MNSHRHHLHPPPELPRPGGTYEETIIMRSGRWEGRRVLPAHHLDRLVAIYDAHGTIAPVDIADLILSAYFYRRGVNDAVAELAELTGKSEIEIGARLMLRVRKRMCKDKPGH